MDAFRKLQKRPFGDGRPNNCSLNLAKKLARRAAQRAFREETRTEIALQIE